MRPPASSSLTWKASAVANGLPPAAGPSGAAVSAPSLLSPCRSFLWGSPARSSSSATSSPLWLALHVMPSVQALCLPRRPSSPLDRRVSLAASALLRSSITWERPSDSPGNASFPEPSPLQSAGFSSPWPSAGTSPIRQLLPGLRLTRRRHRSSLLALHHLPQRPLWRRVQHSVPSSLSRRFFTLRSARFQPLQPQTTLHAVRIANGSKT